MRYAPSLMLACFAAAAGGLVALVLWKLMAGLPL